MIKLKNDLKELVKNKFYIIFFLYIFIGFCILDYSMPIKEALAKGFFPTTQEFSYVKFYFLPRLGISLLISLLIIRFRRSLVRASITAILGFLSIIWFLFIGYKSSIWIIWNVVFLANITAIIFFDRFETYYNDVKKYKKEKSVDISYIDITHKELLAVFGGITKAIFALLTVAVGSSITILWDYFGGDFKEEIIVYILLVFFLYTVLGNTLWILLPNFLLLRKVRNTLLKSKK